MPRFRRLAAVALVLALTSSWALAAPRHEARRSRGEITAAASPASLLLSWFWEWVTAKWTKEGCGIDPSGGCAGGSDTESPPPVGCGSDPNGSPCGGS
jgi:hypothetical protein